MGAIAEPYALWAVESRPGLVLPCTHPAIVLTDELERYERLKLFLLNGGHTFLAECWRRNGLAADLTVSQVMNDAALRRELKALWTQAMVQVFTAIGQGSAAEQYLVALRERLLNPFLAHRLADIAQHHTQKKQRRFAPIIALAAQNSLALPQPRLRAALGTGDS